ncbi:ORF1-s86aa [Fowl aviadenovirus 4]|nr:ORF1-s86aa [Fowl aviadenovirus 4]
MRSTFGRETVSLSSLLSESLHRSSRRCPPLMTRSEEGTDSGRLALVVKRCPLKGLYICGLNPTVLVLLRRLILRVTNALSTNPTLR